MKKNLLISFKLTIILIVLCGGVYPLLIAAIGRLSPGSGKGVTIFAGGKVVGYERVGQKFTGDKYFHGRPSAVDYNASGSGGSNKGPSNPDYLKIVNDRIDSFLVHNPGIKREEIPSELVTASGSGLDPDISADGAYIQVKRIAALRGLSEQKIKELIDLHIEEPLGGGIAPAIVNVLKLNISLDELNSSVTLNGNN